jgi:hypothetical protein
MLRKFWMILAGLGLLAGLAWNAAPALAGDSFHLSLGFGLPGVVYPAPAMVAPPPVVVAPAPVYVAPPAYYYGYPASRHWRHHHRPHHRGYVCPPPGYGPPRHWR